MRLAIVIPAFNAAAYLREAIESAEALRPEAIVVVDDGSTDATAEILAQFGARVRAVSQRNEGVAAARNRGAAAAPEAEWLLFLDADDRLQSKAIEGFRQASERTPAARLLYGQAICFYEDGHTSSWTHGDARSEGPVPSASLASFWKSALTTPGVALIERRLFEEVGGFDPRYCPTEDRDFWMKAGALAEFAYVAGPVLDRRLHAHNASHARGRLRIQGARAQLAFRDWLCEHRLPAGHVPAPTEILEENLKRALEGRQDDAARWLLQEAERRQIPLQRAKLARRLLASPRWWRHAELSLRQRLRAL